MYFNTQQSKRKQNRRQLNIQEKQQLCFVGGYLLSAAAELDNKHYRGKVCSERGDTLLCCAIRNTVIKNHYRSNKP